MQGLSPAEPLRRVLAIGCHADDIEIGCGGTLLTLVAANPELEVDWVVLAAPGERGGEARASAAAFLAGAAAARVEVHDFRDGFLPYVGGEVKEVFEDLKRRVDPQLVLTHAGYDFHQDHRLACELTWNTFRDHLILEYEIPKFDGDLGRPNVFVPLAQEIVERKLALLEEHFPSQVGQALVRPRDVPRADAPSRDGGRCSRRGSPRPSPRARLCSRREVRADEARGRLRGRAGTSRGRARLLRANVVRRRVRRARTRSRSSPSAASPATARRARCAGMHFQTAPHEEAKLVRCTAGAIFDVIVDLRPDSPTCTHWVGVELTAETGRALYIPRGFAHGFQTLVDGAEVFYMISDPVRARGRVRCSLGRPGVRDRLAARLFGSSTSGTVRWPDYGRSSGSL